MFNFEPQGVRVESDQRRFVMVYEDFLDCPHLSGDEKIAFIILKKYGNYSALSQGGASFVYPSLETIGQYTGWERKKTGRVMAAMERKGVIKRYRRGPNMSNGYLLRDTAAMWAAETVEDMAAAAEEAPGEHEARLTAENERLRAENRELLDRLADLTALLEAQRGTAPAGSSADPGRSEAPKAPEPEAPAAAPALSVAEVRELIGVPDAVEVRPGEAEELEQMAVIVADAVNDKRPGAVIKGRKYSRQEIRERLLSLRTGGLLAALDTYHAAAERQKIRNYNGYMLALLMEAAGGTALAMTARVDFDLAHYEPPEEKLQKAPDSRLRSWSDYPNDLPGQLYFDDLRGYNEP